MDRLNRYLNPIERLGLGEMSYRFPLFANLALCVLSETYAYKIAHNPFIVGVYIIFLNIAFIIYFSFRDGILGGLISAIITIIYYFYIIYTRHYSGQQFASSIDTIIELGLIYILLALIIGWLKQTMDKLIGREANERIWLQTILEQLAVGVIITDNKGKIVQTNRQLENILGVKISKDFVIGKDMPTFPVKENKQPVIPAQSPLSQAIKANKPVVGKEFEFERKDGKQVTVQVNASVIKNKKHQVIAAASIITDITQQKELERQKDDFLSMASHELKTPVTSLKMFIDLQRQQLQTKNPQKATYFNERIQDQANRLKELINDLLDVSSIQTNKLRFNKEKFDIISVLHDTVEGLQATTKKNEIVIKGSNSEKVYGDRYRIYQVLVNLISNAIKYSPNSKKIIVSSKKDKKNVVISVQDFGTGINKTQQNKIFERLYQVTDPQEKTFPGLGLGLYISKNIIERHHGKLWVKSTKGKGSTFYFSLPLYNKI
ncbi:MAG TPA: ATP-binding protein [Verrucomicrobiae bacterium]|nr:ATP-binding protein [Verrucomicrobiae bacterium]